MWMFLALLNAAAYAGIAVIDKRLIDRYMPNMSVFYVCIGTAVLLSGFVFLAVGGLPHGAHIDRVLVAGVSGLAWGFALALLFLGYKLKEVSRASAMVFTFPVFVAIFAMVFLGEKLIPLQWGAIGAVVAGATLISMTGPAGTGRTRFTKILPVLLGASLMIATGHATAKYALEELSVAFVGSLHFFGQAAVLLFFWRRRTLSQIRQILSHKQAVALLLVSEGVLTPIALVSLIFATKLGPVSLVATLTSTQPIFVFLYTAILSMPGLRLMNESLNRGTLVLKLISVVMIVAGIISLSLFRGGGLT